MTSTFPRVDGLKKILEEGSGRDKPREEMQSIQLSSIFVSVAVDSLVSYYPVTFLPCVQQISQDASGFCRGSVHSLDRSGKEEARERGREREGETKRKEERIAFPQSRFFHLLEKLRQQSIRRQGVVDVKVEGEKRRRMRRGMA